MIRSIIKTVEISDEQVVTELKKKGVLFEGPDHYVLRGGDHTDCFFYQFPVRNIVTMPLRLIQLIKTLDRDPRELTMLAISDTATRMIRSMFTIFRGHPKKIYPKIESGKMKLDKKQRQWLREHPFLIVDDVIRKGVVLQRVVELCKVNNLSSEGILCAVNSGVPEIGGVTVQSLLKREMRQWSADECPLCREGVSPAYDPYRFKR